MTIEELIQEGKKEIHKDLAMMLLGNILNYNSLELLLHLNDFVNDNQIKEFHDKINLVKNNKPIQYVIGNVNFYGLTYKVNKNVLIPRFETEELVENTINLINKYFSKPLDIIDLGTGSGCIGITLKKKLDNVSVSLVDISNDALLVARDNAIYNNASVNLILSDMWDHVDGKFDVIISNPPYIKINEEIDDIVYNNEPHLALYGGIDGLDLYKKIRKDLESHVKDKFLLALEIGYDQKNDVIGIFNDMDNVKIISKKDLSGRDRMIFVLRNIDI